jgi:hypothetical protein
MQGFPPVALVSTEESVSVSNDLPAETTGDKKS